MEKDIIINITPYDCEIKVTDDERFELWFITTVGDDYTRKKIVKVKLKNYWLNYLAELLWKVVAFRRKAIDGMIKSLKGEG